MWAVSGAILDFVPDLDLYQKYLISIGACFVFARVSTFLLELLMLKTKIGPFNTIRMAFGIVFVLVMQGAVIFFTFHMDEEFGDWGWIVLITYVADIFIWETLAGIWQVLISALFINGRLKPKQIF